MFNPFRSFIRTSAFVKKEVVEIFRQPRLLLTLVLGPFLILLLFGVGYRGEGRGLKTIFVVSPGDPIAKEVQKYAPKLGPQIRFQGIETDFSKAQNDLRRGRVDLVVAAPLNAYRTIKSNQQAVFTLYHNEIDPYQADYIRFTGELYVNKLNRYLLTSLASDKQGDIGAMQSDLKDLLQKTRAFRSALDSGNLAEARQRKGEMLGKLLTLEKSVRIQTAAVDPAASSQAQDTLHDLQRIRADLENNPEIENAPKDSFRAGQIEANLRELEGKLGQIKRIDPNVLFSPFRSQTEPITKRQPKLQEFFTPAVIVLLLQHLAVTLAALSIVREFRAGTAELFKVSPLLKGELLLGKYAGYLLVGATVALALTVALVRGLHMPMFGNWYEYGGVLLLLLFTSLGLGFLISLISTTDSQAIQYSMILLLLSIFFTGFLLSLQMLWEPVRIISWLLPATYGIQLLQDIMLRGAPANVFLLATLAGSGMILFAICAWLLSRRLAAR